MPTDTVPPARLAWTPARRAGFVLYQALLHPVIVLFLLRILARRRREPLYAAGLGQRFGRVPRLTPGAIWLHAASLGEMRAAAPLLRRLLDAGERIVLTHTSPAGLAEGRRQFGAEIAAGRVVQLYQTVDLWWAVARFLRRTRPRLAVTVDSETWPAAIAACAARGIPVAKVNANLSERALERDLSRWWGRLRLFFWQGLTLVTTKSQAHAGRYRRAGIDPARIRDVGEMRFDIPLDPAQIAAAGRLRPGLRPGPVLLIASSHELEETPLIAILHRLRRDLPALPPVIWVPRSPQRFAPLPAALAEAGFTVARRSRALAPDLAAAGPIDAEILVGDSLGEMDFFYALADLAVVGGTLTDRGGHNVTEPLAQGVPVLTGPSVWRIPAPADEARAAGAMLVCRDADELGAGLSALLSDPAALARFRAATAGLGERHRGSAARTARALLSLAPPPPGYVSANGYSARGV
ncbi:MAG: 3-deoxy-D-manno-octulosonic acid transferase [Tranquillimonas sp.]